MAEKIKLDKNMKFESDGSIRYMGSKPLNIIVPMYYEKDQLLTVSDNLVTLGIFPIWYDKEPRSQFFVPAMLTMCPSTLVYQKEAGDDVVFASFTKGDLFLKSRTVVKTEYIAFVLFNYYIGNNHIPNLITYDNLATLFQTVANITGSKIGGYNNAVFEILFAHTTRSIDNIQIPYRLTDMKKPFYHIKLSDMAHITTSTTAKLISGYLTDSINTAINTDVENESKLEEILRQ
jgi:hypothetical protein